MLEEYHCGNSSGDDMEEVQFIPNRILFSHISYASWFYALIIKNALRASYKDALRNFVINLYIEPGCFAISKLPADGVCTFEVIAMNIIGSSQSVSTPVSTLSFIQPLRNLNGPCRNQNR